MENRQPVFQRKAIEISPLPTVKDILGRINFLRYSTQLRNLAYQIQFFEFLRAFHKNYKIDRGLESIYVMQICYVASNIIEHLLFCGLSTANINLNSSSRHKKATALNQTAKKSGMISKKLSKDLQIFIDIRNDFHPEKQTDLHIKKVDVKLIQESRLIINRLGRSIREFLVELKKKNEQMPF